MQDDNSRDKRVETVKERLQDDLVDDRGNTADVGEVSRVVDEAAAQFADAPVQEFTPLLIEHQARDELRQQGLRRDLDDDQRDEVNEGTEASAEQPDGSADSRDRRDALHLSTQEGLTSPTLE